METDEEMKQFDLVLKILGEERSVDGEGQQAISDAFQKLAKERDNFHQQQDNVEDMLEARDGIIAGLRERLITLTTGEASSELEKKRLNTKEWEKPRRRQEVKYRSERTNGITCAPPPPPPAPAPLRTHCK